MPWRGKIQRMEGLSRRESTTTRNGQGSTFSHSIQSLKIMWGPAVVSSSSSRSIHVTSAWTKRLRRVSSSSRPIDRGETPRFDMSEAEETTVGGFCATVCFVQIDLLGRPTSRHRRRVAQGTDPQNRAELLAPHSDVVRLATRRRVCGFPRNLRLTRAKAPVWLERGVCTRTGSGSSPLACAGYEDNTRSNIGPSVMLMICIAQALSNAEAY